VTEAGEERVAVDALRPGDRIRVRPGERIAADGIVLEGDASVSEAEITGEPLPATRGPGDAVAACTLNLDGSLLVEVKRTGADTTVARVVRLVEEARAGKYPFAQLVDRLSAAFVPFVLALAAATFGYWTYRAGVGEGVLNSLSVLLIACPCAIGIATPLACTAAAGRAAAAGVLVRSGEAFERLSRAKRAFLDKTGTLTKGELELASVAPAAGRTEESLFALAAAVEESSEHPVAVAIRRDAARRGVSPLPVSAFRAFPGRGVEAVLAFGAGDGFRAEAPGISLVRIGTPSYVGGPAETDGANGANGANGTVVQVAVDGEYVGSLTFRDEVRPSARAAVAGLEAKGLAVEVLSGDRAPSVAAFAAGFPGLATSAGLVPEEKLARVRASIAAGDEPLMVGDGINDAPALSGAGIGVTLESGTDLAREVSDVTILGGDLSKLPWTVGLARRTVAVARVNLFWAFFYNGIGLALAVTGHLHPLFGAVAMMGSSLFVVVHSQRLSRYPLPGTES
jgi:Cu+-exporting ATPase